MTQTDSRSLQQIKYETERTRAGLTDTVEQLRASVAETASDIRHHLSPDTIKAEVSEYIKSRGERLWEDITTAARNNPMQAVAVGASVAYPMLRLARTIPLPVLMIGAGLFLAGSKTGQAATRKAAAMASDFSDEAGRRARELKDRVGESALAAREFASDQLEQASDAVSEGISSASQKVDALRGVGSFRFQTRAASIGSKIADEVAGLKHKSVRSAGSAVETIQDVSSGAASAARKAAGTAASAGPDAAKSARDTVAGLTGRTGKTVAEFIEENPLWVAGAGLLVGGLIASVLPRSDVESELAGDASKSLKRRAEALASQGVDAAKGVVGEVYDRAARQAEDEGLTPDGISEAAKDIGQRVRRVAESAVTTAFEPEDHLQQNANRGRNHGGPDIQSK